MGARHEVGEYQHRRRYGCRCTNITKSSTSSSTVEDLWRGPCLGLWNRRRRGRRISRRHLLSRRHLHSPPLHCPFVRVVESKAPCFGPAQCCGRLALAARRWKIGRTGVIRGAPLGCLFTAKILSARLPPRKQQQRARPGEPTHFEAPARALSGGRRLWGLYLVSALVPAVIDWKEGDREIERERVRVGFKELSRISLLSYRKELEHKKAASSCSPRQGRERERRRRVL